MSVGHRIDAPTAGPRFRSDTLIERYLNPMYEPGCGVHEDLSCLCDVKVTEPVEVVAVPQRFLWVETADDLVHAAADMWVELDVLGHINPRYGPDHDYRIYFINIDLTSAAACKAAADAVAAGASNEELQQEYGSGKELTKIIRLALDKPLKQKRYPYELAARMIESGMMLREVSDRLFEVYGDRWHNATISDHYKTHRGRSVTEFRMSQAPSTMGEDEG